MAREILVDSRNSAIFIRKYQAPPLVIDGVGQLLSPGGEFLPEHVAHMVTPQLQAKISAGEAYWEMVDAHRAKGEGPIAFETRLRAKYLHWRERAELRVQRRVDEVAAIRWLNLEI